MSVKIRRERSDQRRHHRVTASLYIEIAGHKLRASNWSLGGVFIENYPGPLPAVEDQLELKIALPFQGFDVSFEAIAQVERLQEDSRAFALQFIELGEREQELMQHFIEELVRGSMIDVEDTIQRIDVPVTPASLEPDVKSIKSEAPLRRWPVKTIMMSGLYLVFGFAVFGYALTLIFTNFFRMEIQTAVISAPIEMVKAPIDGYVDWRNFKPGDTVRPGDLVVQLYDNNLEREIELANISVQERKAKLAFLRKKQFAELERVKSYAAVEMKNVRQTRSELDALQAQLSIGQKNLERLRELYAKGFTTQVKLDDAESEVINIRKDIDNRTIELGTLIELADQNFGKRLFNGRDVVGEAPTVDAEVRLAEHEIMLAQKRFKSHVKHRERHAIRAPFAGKILEMPRVDNSNVRRGDIVAILEQSGQRHVSAYLTQEEVLKVGLGDEAILYIPGLGEKLLGRVANIDRTSGFVRQQDKRLNPGYSWRGPDDRSAKVTINFSQPELVTDLEKYKSGLPVVVIFERRTASGLFTSVLETSKLAM